LGERRVLAGDFWGDRDGFMLKVWVVESEFASDKANHIDEVFEIAIATRMSFGQLDFVFDPLLNPMPFTWCVFRAKTATYSGENCHRFRAKTATRSG